MLEEKRKAFPEHFSALIAFSKKYKEFPLDHVLPYGSELRFYTAMITMIKKLKKYGFAFCKPRVMAKNKNTSPSGEPTIWAWRCAWWKMTTAQTAWFATTIGR